MRPDQARATWVRKQWILLESEVSFKTKCISYIIKVSCKESGNQGFYSVFHTAFLGEGVWPWVLFQRDYTGGSSLRSLFFLSLLSAYCLKPKWQLLEIRLKFI